MQKLNKNIQQGKCTRDITISLFRLILKFIYTISKLSSKLKVIVKTENQISHSFVNYNTDNERRHNIGNKLMFFVKNNRQ